ncbi:HPr kinase/phosphorylase [Meinhardsimonia xiamenensis]|jgi:HPr kinase/phosphorylase|uniref:HPr kinase/phosphorylase n=1 Tax=Meinhardsimonia xiamenensis TaxID=990712 RepID=A0A1G8ZK33_9RHOB|nr:serine kinase [Meinhardsimonia xiamenensis]PRX37716.1 HPr kinase/phosphorylase [Meinhardsimonia xiamenensis]SDK14500.1 HPr kinase/phosphorylase [Meinhardsimonia xiamenensis]
MGRANTIVHGTAVALSGRAVLFVGPSGSGKSGHALALMALGADLVADDRTEIAAREGRLIVSAPPSLRGVIEARGVGLLRAASRQNVPLALVVDLGRREEARLPPQRTWECLSLSVPLLHKVESAILIPAIVQYLRGGGLADV